jgi:hypothetical protein
VSNPQEEFIKSGFKFFPQAVEAVEEFAKLLHEDLKGAIKSVEIPTGLRVEEPTKLTWGSAPGKGCWVFAFVPVLKGKVKFMIDLGLWWNAPGAQTAVVSYCSPFQAKRRLRFDGYKPREVEVAKVNGFHRLCVNAPVPGALAFEPLLREGLRVILADKQPPQA